MGDSRRTFGGLAEWIWVPKPRDWRGFGKLLEWSWGLRRKCLILASEREGYPHLIPVRRPIQRSIPPNTLCHGRLETLIPKLSPLLRWIDSPFSSDLLFSRRLAEIW